MVDWDYRFLRLAEEVSTWSKDPSTQVGAVLARGKHVVSVGFNGFPAGMNDSPTLYADRAVKNSRTIHAEANAILNARHDVAGCIVYVTQPPCANCALTIIQAGIRRVVALRPSETFRVRWGKSLAQAQAFFEEADVEYVETERH